MKKNNKAVFWCNTAVLIYMEFALLVTAIALEIDFVFRIVVCVIILMGLLYLRRIIRMYIFDREYRIFPFMIQATILTLIGLFALVVVFVLPQPKILMPLGFRISTGIVAGLAPLGFLALLISLYNVASTNRHRDL